MAKKVETKKLSIDCPIDLLDRLGRLSDCGDIPRQRLIVNFIGVGVDYLEASMKVDILSLVVLMRYLKKNAIIWADKISKSKIDGFDMPE